MKWKSQKVTLNKRNIIKTEYELYCKRFFTLNTLFSIGHIGFQSVNAEIPVTDTQFRTPQSPFKFNASEWFFVSWEPYRKKLRPDSRRNNALLCFLDC